jgi:hypothetical protein
VVSPAFCSEIEEMDGITRIRRKFEKEDINGMLFVIGATDDEKVNLFVRLFIVVCGCHLRVASGIRVVKITRILCLYILLLAHNLLYGGCN